MHTNGHQSIPRELFHWITFLTQALPPKSAATFIELLLGAMLSSSGFVTGAYLSLDMQLHWTSYYKWLQKGHWSWLALARQFVRLVLSVVTQDVVYLAIDDTLTLRASKKAPASQIHHQHGNKPNLAAYVRGQCWVSLAWVIRISDHRHIALPLLNRLTPTVGNTGKLVAANTLIRSVYRLFNERSVRVLVDSWYMRRVFIESMLSRGFHVIGQARIDTRLFDLPDRPKVRQRGRPRLYGAKYTPERIQALPATEVTLPLYGKQQVVRYRSKHVKAYFLKGREVRAVWCEFQTDEGVYRKAALLLSTDPDLSPEQIIVDYARRWSIESMFNQLKEAWGVKQAWQQTRQTLHRWVQLTAAGYGLIQLLSYLNNDAVQALCQHSPWRKKAPLTAGLIRTGLRMNLMHVRVRVWWDRTCRKFQPPDASDPP